MDGSCHIYIEQRTAGAAHLLLSQGNAATVPESLLDLHVAAHDPVWVFADMFDRLCSCVRKHIVCECDCCHGVQAEKALVKLNERLEASAPRPAAATNPFLAPPEEEDDGGSALSAGTRSGLWTLRHLHYLAYPGLSITVALTGFSPPGNTKL